MSIHNLWFERAWARWQERKQRQVNKQELVLDHVYVTAVKSPQHAERHPVSGPVFNGVPLCSPAVMPEFVVMIREGVSACTECLKRLPMCTQLDVDVRRKALTGFLNQTSKI